MKCRKLAIILRPSVRVGLNGKLCISTLAGCTLTFVAIRFKKAWAHGIRRFPSREATCGHGRQH